ncbi:ABC transporter permease subunit [Iocasia frigidifontis]|uniref:ABC transporter permease subunit n=2 Tax=Iocasia fonsfrigidae TaxID=2682810 RepID=A0A8A7KGN3_9FIRM|nr:ABC transporter permease subunit [Iocasia fonsfrigidae]
MRSILLGPSLFLLVCIIAYPVYYAIVLSLTNTHLLMPNASEFIGLKNYIELFLNKDFYTALYRSIVWVISCVSFQLIAGLIGALIMDQNFKGRGLVRGISLVPWATPSVLVALMWAWLLDGNYGVINDLLQKLGLIRHYIPWLAQGSTALPSVILANIWQGTPFFAVMLLASLQSIPEELYEAAKIDSANSWQIFWYIKLPFLLPTILITSMLRIMWTANYMDLIYIMTGGGPGSSSMILPVYSYIKAYKKLEMGQGAAVAIIQVVLLLIVVLWYLRLLKKRGRDF